MATVVLNASAAAQHAGVAAEGVYLNTHGRSDRNVLEIGSNVRGGSGRDLSVAGEAFYGGDRVTTYSLAILKPIDSRSSEGTHESTQRRPLKL